MMKKLLISWLLVSSFINSVEAAMPTVNILSWFGYLRSPQINKLVQDQCHVTLSVDEYYSNDEFLRRWKSDKNNYDLIVFANLLYKTIEDEITLKYSDLSQVSQNYHPVIKQHYIDGHYANNVVYFSHSIMGFLWNPSLIHLSEQDDMYSVFAKAKNNRVVLIDDPMEVRNMIHLGNDKQVQLNLKNLRAMLQSAQVTFTNDYNKIYETPNFAFSYTWSGDAMLDIQKSGKSYQFLIHPKTSFICTDLLAQTKVNAETNCVAKVLSSKTAMNILQNANYYFSPYGDYKNIESLMFKKTYQDVFHQLSQFSWIQSVTEQEIKELEQSWKVLKLEISAK
jgi:hypothetical protein